MLGGQTLERRGCASKGRARLGRRHPGRHLQRAVREHRSRRLRLDHDTSVGEGGRRHRFDGKGCLPHQREDASRSRRPLRCHDVDPAREVPFDDRLASRCKSPEQGVGGRSRGERHDQRRAVRALAPTDQGDRVGNAILSHGLEPGRFDDAGLDDPGKPLLCIDRPGSIVVSRPALARKPSHHLLCFSLVAHSMRPMSCFRLAALDAAPNEASPVPDRPSISPCRLVGADVHDRQHQRAALDEARGRVLHDALQLPEEAIVTQDGR